MRIGIDLGGTKIEAIALASDGATLLRRRVATPRGDYAATIATIAALVAEAESGTCVRGTVGVGIPGAISPASGLVKNANSTWLIGQPLQQDLERALQRPVRIENDANCLAVSEAIDGAAAGAACVWAVILGTGVGSGIAIGGRALSGANRIAGEWGHNPLPWPRDDERPGPACYCGRSGCIETFLSGPGFARDHLLRFGEDLAADAVVARMRAGDPRAAASFDIYVDRLARGFAHVVNILDPDMIVLGGGLSNVDELYGAVALAMPRYVFSDAVTTPIVRNRHGDSSGVRGAAWLWEG